MACSKRLNTFVSVSFGRRCATMTNMCLYASVVIYCRFSDYICSPPCTQRCYRCESAADRLKRGKEEKGQTIVIANQVPCFVPSASRIRQLCSHSLLLNKASKKGTTKLSFLMHRDENNMREEAAGIPHCKLDENCKACSALVEIR